MPQPENKGIVMKGFKATDKDMKCRGYQFELGKWHEHEGKLRLCESGFHFCKYPSGVFSYYDVGCRVFEIEAEGVLDLPETPGADYKLVCRRIRLVKEIFPEGSRNTGSRNTGSRNTGDGNTGYGNTGENQTGFFCKSVPVFCFDKATGLSQKQFTEKYPEWEYLFFRLFEGAIDWDKVKGLPGITKRKLSALLKAHRGSRKEKT